MRTGSAIGHGRLLAKMSRPQNIVYSGGLAAGTAYVGTRSLVSAAACYMIIWLLYAIAAVFNNLQDVATDRYNHRYDNPLTKQQVLLKELVFFVVVCCLALIWLQFAASQPGTVVICLAYGVLLAAYSHPVVRIQSRGWWACLVLAVCYGGLPPLLGAVQWPGGLTAAVWQLSSLQVLLLAPLLMAKDYKDLVGDSLTGKLTPLVRYGPVTVAAMANIIGALAATAMVIIMKGKWPAAALSYMAVIVCLHLSYGQLWRPVRLILSGVLLAVAWQQLS
jgi:4-hydroxybenzoate polyprenyltransferase